MKVAEIEFDGGCTGNGSPHATGTFGYILRFEGKEFAGMGRVGSAYGRIITNNVAEYAGLLNAVRRFKKECASPKDYELMIYGDSRLVVETVAKRWGWSKSRVLWNPHKKQPHLREILFQVLKELEDLNYQTAWIRREKNRRADALTRM